MSERILYISGRCEHSKKILIGIQQYEYLKPLFRVINVDTQPFPNYIQSVPSIFINGQVITGSTVFEYLGKLVEGKKQQEQRVSNGEINSSDQGQCRINEEGELEGWCGSGSGVDYSMITEENDDYTKKSYKINTNLSFLDDNEGNIIKDQVQQMEQLDDKLNEKRKQFDNDYERLQKERNEIGIGMGRK